MAFARKDLGTSDWSPQGSGNGFAVGNPLALSSIKEHWRAQNIAAGAVASWTGRNSTYTLAQATGGNQPTNTASQINSKASVIFNNAAANYVDTGASNMVIAQPWEVWFLFKQISFVSGSYLFEMGNSTLDTYGFFTTSTNLRIVSGSTTFNNTISASGWNLIRIQSAAGANASSITLNNGASNVWGTPTAGTMTKSTQRLILGAKADGTTNSNISVADIVVTNAQLSASEVTFMLNYYRNYYGLVL